MSRALLVLGIMLLALAAMPAASAKEVSLQIAAKRLNECGGGATFCFDKETLSAGPGDQVTIVFTNPADSGAPHSWCIALAGESCTPNAGSGGTPAGQVGNVTFLAPSSGGPFKYFCKEPGHDSLGMNGNFTLSGAPSPTPSPSPAPSPPARGTPFVGALSLLAGVALLAVALRRR